jgi:predicted membrane protein (TIGR00267 family)
MGYISRLRELARTARKTEDLDSVMRRYFVIGAFDGALTILGILFGAFAAGQLTEKLVIAAGVSGGVGLSVSSLVGAYEAERVERKVALGRLKQSMLKEPRKDYISAMRFAAMIAALVHAISPLLAALIPIIPFILIADVGTAMAISIFLTLSFLFIMGAFMGAFAKEFILYSGLRFVTAGLATALIIYLIEKVI